MKTVKIFLIFLMIKFSYSANILGIISLPSGSHLVWNKNLYQALAQRGHNITVIAADIDKKNENKNIHYIHADAYKSIDFGNVTLLDTVFDEMSPFMTVIFAANYYKMSCDGFLKSDGFKTLLNYPDDFKFDLVIYDFTAGPCLLGFLHKFNYPPIVGVSPFSAPPNTFDLAGGHKKPSYVLHYGIADENDQLSYFKRLRNTLVYLWDDIYQKYFFIPSIDKMMRKSYQFKDLPYAGDLENMITLALVNTHYSIENTEPMPASVIPVGGLQIRDPKPLEGDVKNFVESGKKGTILFSLGTNIRSDFMDQKNRQMFIDTFEKFPQYNFIWKFESDIGLKLPSNVKISPWLNQNDILADKNVKAFISHGGLLSTQEAAWYGVPVVGIPFFVDQSKNVKRGLNAGTHIELSFKTLSVSVLENALKEILENPKYTQNAQRRSKLFRDMPEKPLDRGIFWIEWMLRHKDDHSSMIPPSKKMSWFISNSYDIILTFVALLHLIIFSTIKLMKKMKTKNEIVVKVFDKNASVSHLTSHSCFVHQWNLLCKYFRVNGCCISKNHALMLALAERGHNVTVFSPDTETRDIPSTLHYIHAEKAYEIIANDPHGLNLLGGVNNSAFEEAKTPWRFGELGCRGIIGSIGFQTLLNYPDDFKFDAVIYDFTCGPCLLGFVHKFNNPPLIGVTAFGTPHYTNDIMGGHKTDAFVPHFALEYGNEMNLIERFHNVLVHGFDYMYREFIAIPRQDAMMRQYFPRSPDFGSIERQMRIALVNTHFAYEYTEPTPPNIIHVGGLQIKDPKPLNEKIRQFIKSARKGTILFSLGSNMKSEMMDDARKLSFLEAFSSFPDYNFIWKYETDKLPTKNIPKNVFITPWLDQNSILAHKNVVAFITHAGLLSTTEAVWWGKPMIGIPIFVDQYKNLAKSVNSQIAIKLNYASISGETVKNALKEILYNEKYVRNAKLRSKLFQDQPQKPLERAVFWIEWTIRHKDDYHPIESPVKKLGPFKANMFDMILYLIVILMLISYLLGRHCHKRTEIHNEKKKN
uniref:CSON008880 protein n=1 Tax=Culicoides sonorensis TaxID=179676 RepID=A0A336LZ62_CULSO